MDTKAYADELARAAKAAAGSVARASTAEKDAVLERIARSLTEGREELKSENRKDLEAGRQAGLSSAMLDRLRLTDKRIAGHGGRRAQGGHAARPGRPRH